MPTPRKNEEKGEYISRCMASDEMQEEFKDRKQRYAVCQKYWENNKK